MALILYWVMRGRLRSSDTLLSPEQALSKLRRIQHQQIILNSKQPVADLRLGLLQAHSGRSFAECS